MIVTCNQKLVWHIIAILCSAVGSLILFVDRFIIQEEVRREVTLNNDSQYLMEWINDTTPVSAKFHVFNITNSHLVETGKEEDIHLLPLGPFVFEVERERRILFMNDSVIEYQPINFFTYDEVFPGNAPLDAFVTMANIPLATIMSKANASGVVASGACAILARASSSKVFTRRSARQILFEGYRDPLFALVKMMEEAARFPGADEIPDEFAIMKDQNGLPFYGNWTVLRGLGSPDQTMQLVRWNGEEGLNFHPGSNCDELRGNDGSKFRSGVEESDVLFLFLVADFCSGIPFTFDSYSSVGPLRTMRFKLNFNDTAHMNCLTDNGVVDVSPCHKGSPIFLSAPHFFGASDSLFKGIHGLEPNQSLHESFMDIEPLTGILLRIVMRLQVNVKVSKDNIFSVTRSLPFDEKIIPVIWIEQFAEASSEAINKLDQQIFVKVRALKYVSWSLIVAGTLIVMLIHAVTFFRKRKEKKLSEQLVREVSVSEHETSASESVS